MAYSNKVFISSSEYMQSLLLHIILIPFAFSIQDYELTYKCSATSYVAGSNYSQSLTYLVDDLCFNAPLNKGFRNASWAESPRDRAYGLALCRGDVSRDKCKECLTNATIPVLNTYCPYNLGAIIVRQFCLLKYSYIDFLGKLDPVIYYSTKGPDCGQTIDRGSAAIILLRNLSETAIQAPHKLFFANGTTVVETNKKLYGMVQCTGDLSAGDCGACLNGTINDLLSWCKDKVGVHVVTGSCSVRYQLYPFLY